MAEVPAAISISSFDDLYKHVQKDHSSTTGDKLVGVCLAAIQKAKSEGGGADSIVALSKLVAEGAVSKNSEQKALAEKIARAFSKTTMYGNQTHDVRDNFKKALTGGAFIWAQLKEIYLTPRNLSRYGVDESKKQERLTQACLTLVSPPAGTEEEPIAAQSSKISKEAKEAFISTVTGEDAPIFRDRKEAEKFLNDFLAEAEKLELGSFFHFADTGKVAVAEIKYKALESDREGRVKEDLQRKITIVNPVKFAEDVSGGVTGVENVGTILVATEILALPTVEEINPTTLKFLQGGTHTELTIFTNLNDYKNEHIKYLMRYTLFSLKHGAAGVDFDFAKKLLGAYKRCVVDPFDYYGFMETKSNAPGEYARSELLQLLDEVAQSPNKKITDEEVVELREMIVAKNPDVVSCFPVQK